MRDLCIVATAALGLGLMLYPSAAQWFFERGQAAEISGYFQQVDSMPHEVRTDLLSQAEAYNSSLPPGPFRDPYTIGEGTDLAATQVANEQYRSLLNTDGTQVMGRVRIPSIHVDLPIYHGTDEETLARGAGHLPPSSLPVGGAGTHAVITAHSGLANAPLFTDLDKVALGDTFMIDVLGETLYYRVDQILVVAPTNVDALQIVPGKDYVTLVTCTPLWVNSHRLLVRGERIPAPPQAAAVGERPVPPAQGPGVPWWALIEAAGVAGALVVTRTLLSKPAQRRA